ncbi:MAG TPA: hypothetical protein VLH56_19255 [Dissulfurispiraceae bacterium]|nr:hypothetical protein [Dissulfurispiraceae bacterium]
MANLIQHDQIEPYDLDDINDVNAPAPNDEDVLTWDNVAGEWIASPASSEFTLAGSAGTATISTGDTLTVAAGTGVLSTPVTAVDTVTINTCWKRTGTQIEPQTADDYLKVQIGTPAGAAPTGGAIRVHSTTFGIDVRTDAGGGINAVCVGGSALIGTSTNDAGVTGSSTNDYGLKAAVGGVYSDSYYDVDDEASVANPNAGAIRIWAASDGMAYTQTSGGIIACLTSQGKETHWVSSGPDPNDPTASFGLPANDNGCAINWAMDAMPGGTATAAGVTYTNQCTFATPAAIGDVVTLDETHGRWNWTARRNDGGDLYEQSYIVVGSTFQLFSGDAGTTACKAARAYCRVRVTNTAHYHSIKLILSDQDGTNSTSASLLASMSNNTWYVGATAITDISTWTGPLRVSVVAYGRALADEEMIGPQVDVEYVACEEYAN